MLPATANIHHETGMRYAKLFSHLFITHPDNGNAHTKAITISFRKSFDSSATIAASLAPSTLRIPISFVRVSAENVASPNKPRQAMSIAMHVNDITMPDVLFSFS